MTPYNISVVKPEEEPAAYNALQLQAVGSAFGHHSGSLPYPETHFMSSGQSGHMYPHISTSGLANNPYISRPHLTQLETEPTNFASGLQSSSSLEMDETRRHYWRSSALQPSTIPSGWAVVDSFTGTNSPSLGMNGSPMSQGYSPLTPNTPLSTVEPSPTVSSLPSPGSQGSNEVSHLAPSPIYHPTALGTASELPGTLGQLQLDDFYCHHGGSETQLFTSPTYAQTTLSTNQQVPDTTYMSSQTAILTRRHSHSTLDRTQQQGSQSSGFSPYPIHSPLPARNPVVRTRIFPEIPLVPRQEYKFEDWALPGPVIPQTQYLPHSASDRKRYVQEFPLQEPIYFRRDDSLCIGITLPECVTQRFKQLIGHNDELFEGLGPSISVRLNWTGYESWSRQIPTRNFKVPQGPITRKQLAKNIAKTVQRFIDEHIDRSIQSGSDPHWQVGPGKIEFGDLILLSIHHVSRGSWQVNLCLNQPLEQILSRAHVPH